MPPVDPLQPQALYARCDPGQFAFRTTDDLEELENSLGQARALEALRFGIAIGTPGYNMFALGPPGTGKHSMVRRHLEDAAAAAPVPTDWTYVNNFAEPHKPSALEFPPGRARGFRDEMERLIRDMRDAIPSLFESDDYRARREAMEEEFKSRQEGAFGELQEAAHGRALALIRTPMGLAFAPVKDGEVINPDDFRKLPDDRQQKTKDDIAELEKRLQEIMRTAQQWEREHRQKVRQLNQEMAERVVGHLIDEQKAKMADLPAVVAWIEDVRADIVENAQQFLPQPTGEDAPDADGRTPTPAGRPGAPPTFFRRYQVNVVVDRTACATAPVIYEDHPTQPNLVGRIEHMAQFGALVTDFNLIKAGALLQANGGFLILDALKVLTQPYAWEELKRALRAAEARIEGLAEALGLSATVSLQPEPIPLDVKVVLVGDREIYYMLAQADPDFAEMFKVAIDFDDVVDRSETTMHDYARMIATMVRRDRLSPLDTGAVARVIEHASRLVSDSEKLSARMRLIVDLLHESHFHAGAEDQTVITAAHVQHAIDAQTRRADRIRERVHEQITRGTVLIDTEGA
ncbi:MAG: ATP-binding protein, partial [Alphaproteobacteria bacterium]